MSAQILSINAREYRFPKYPTVAITLDGCDPRYLDDAFARNLMPNLRRMIDSGGSYHLGRGNMPSFTNVNNMSIVTGGPPNVHGLPGNHYLAPTGEEVQLSDAKFLRAPSIHAELQTAGARVLLVTAKHKLRMMLAHGDVPATSAEKAHEWPLPQYGIDDILALVGRKNPGPYEWDMSHYAIEIGIAVSKKAGPLDLMYLSTTDFVQHAEGPGGEMSDRFLARFDVLLQELLDLGYSVGITADHGMNAKHDATGAPRVHYLEDVLDAAGVRDFHVVLPITDPYVVHHGALGSFAWVHCPEEYRAAAYDALIKLDGVEEVFTREEAAVIYQHPMDRIGDFSVASDGRTVLGKAASKHDLTVLHGPLRSHGGRHEQIVPIITSRTLTLKYKRLAEIGLTNSDLHDLLLNGVE